MPLRRRQPLPDDCILLIGPRDDEVRGVGCRRSVIDTVGVKTDRRLPWLMSMARRTARLCMWWNLIGWLITKSRKRCRNAVQNFRLPGAAEGWAPDPRFEASAGHPWRAGD
jgi:hypothetical protein